LLVRSRVLRVITMQTHTNNVKADSYPSIRRHPRSPYSVPIFFHGFATGFVRTTRGISVDISEGGVGALVQGSLRVGEMGSIDVPLPEHVLTTIAIVRHTSDMASGFEFVGLTAEERYQIALTVGQG
jgi:hypothetical protein